MTSMTFSFYGSLDQQWIDLKIEEFDIDSYDMIEIVGELCFEAKALIESPNPLIYVLLDCIARKLFETDEVQELSDGIKEQFFSGVYDTFFINCFDSHMDPIEVVENLQDEIVSDYRESFLDLSSTEINEKFKNLVAICEEYSF